MKIGIINYPSASFSDIAALLEIFKKIQSPEDFQYEICSYLPFSDKEDVLAVKSSQIGLPLVGFDVLVLPGSEKSENGFLDIHWATWMRSVEAGTTFYGFNQGGILLENLKLNNQWKSTLINPLNGYFTALVILNNVLSPDEILEIARQSGIETYWQSFLQSLNLRKASISRKTAETKININLDLDGNGKSDIETGIPFLDHMVNQISRHGLFNIKLKAVGDLEIDQHHTMEDCGIILGDAFRQALRDRKGINRMASATIPMDESLATVTIDFSGRPYCVIQSRWNGENIGELPVSLFEHFLESFAIAARCNLFIQVHAGKDNHHMCEAIFKALARALYQSCGVDIRRSGQIPSTKDMLF
jgi:imidazoleglycerol-phosphate dehydratase